MINSMTGFGRAEEKNGQRKCVVEIRTGNHRFLDINIRMPSKDFGLEMAIKELVSAAISRGSADLSLSFTDTENSRKNLSMDEDMIRQYLDAAKKIKDIFPVYGEADLVTLLSLKDVFKYEEVEVNLEERWELMQSTIKKALDHLLEMRRREGKNLKKDILKRLKEIEASAKSIKDIGEKWGKSIARKIKAKIKEMFEDVKADEQRVITEAAILAERYDITEEITRLNSHLEQAGNLLEEGGMAGRKLEFILHEMNREANTIGSKSTLYDISREVVEIKSELEKIREQAANIE